MEEKKDERELAVKTLRKQLKVLSEAFDKAVEAGEEFKYCGLSGTTVEVAKCLLAFLQDSQPRS